MIFPKKNIAIIGSGWYGCHISSYLLSLNQNIKIFDKSEGFFSGASGSNQNRLHLGLHYPRCSKTRFYSKNGFKTFKKTYPSLSKKIDKNYYGIHKYKSILDFHTYKAILMADKINFRELDDNSFFKFENLSGLIECDEEYIDHEKSKKYFENNLINFFEGNFNVDDDNKKKLQKSFDLVIDCSWGGVNNRQDDNIFYESCLFLIYESKIDKKIGLTVMDGNLFSLYPFKDNLYSLTSVKELPLSTHKSQKEAIDFGHSFIANKKFLEEKINRFEKEILDVFPSFKNNFKFCYPKTSFKTKFKSPLDSRLVKYFRKGNFLSIYAGKIDTVFYAEPIVRKAVFNE